MGQNELVRISLNNRRLEESGFATLLRQGYEGQESFDGQARSSGYECPGRHAALSQSRSLAAWTERSEVKVIWIVLPALRASLMAALRAGCLAALGYTTGRTSPS